MTMTRISLALVPLTVAFMARPALGQIKEPGSHPHYSFELEPHLAVGWIGGPHHFNDEGVGLGLRASIPLFHNGPISSINNNMAITFGLDWLYFGYDHDRACRDFGGVYCDDHDFSASAFWVPVAVQWNFFVHPKISVFGELGLAIVHERWSWARKCPDDPPGMPDLICDYRDTHTDFAELVFYPGARFMLSDNVGFTVRLGFPHLTLGASFLF
jgi:hypothetical protein